LQIKIYLTIVIAVERNLFRFRYNLQFQIYDYLLTKVNS